jgi:two-component system sensor histidine kinase KdpD
VRFPSQIPRQFGRAAASVAGVVAITLTAGALPVNATAASLSFLLFVLVVASRWGLTPAIVASLTATVLFNFHFLPPVGTLTIADPQNWIALAAFLITAVIASELSNRAKQQAVAADEQRREVERLYELSRAVLLDAREDSAGRIAQHIAGAFGFEGVMFHDIAAGKRYSAGPRDVEAPAGRLEAIQGTVDLADGSRATPVRLGNKAVGVLAIQGEVGKPAIEAIANLVAITVERAASQEMANRARAARKSEELKSSILDALAHDFKTPLTSIKAAATALLSRSPRNELLTIIDEEADRLNKLVTEAIQASHIEAGRIKLERRPTDIRELIGSVIEQMKPRFDDRRVHVETSGEVPPVLVDRELMELAVRQLIDNALKYSRSGTPIVLHAQADGDAVQLSVRDSGPGIASHEQEKIFEKFYRGEAIRNQLPGTGVGLNIVKDIVTAHAGVIRVQSAPNLGTTFTIELPALREAGV